MKSFHFSCFALVDVECCQTVFFAPCILSFDVISRILFIKNKRSRLRMSLCDNITRYAMQEEKKERRDKNGINCATRNLRSIAGKFDANIPIDISRSGT